MSDTPRRRTVAFGSTATAPAPQPGEPVVVVDAAALTERYNTLRQRRDQLNGVRLRREGELESAQRAEAQCAEEAKALGVNSIQELEELIQSQGQQDAQALDKLALALDEQENLLRGIDERVATADAR